jgi:curved DNA-binding protein CbpA
LELWEEDLYELLGVEEASTPEEIKKAYKKLAIELHPDRFPDDAAKREEATVQFGKITNAYNILKDEEERAEYDFARRLGFAGSGGPGPSGGAKAAGGAKGAGGKDEAQQAKGGTGPIEDEGGVSEARRNQAQNQFDLGKIAHKGKNWAKAIQHYKEAARLDPAVADYPAYLGLAYTQQGLKTPALKAFEQAYKLDRKHAIVKEHYSPPSEAKKATKGGGFFGSLLALFGGGKKDDAKDKKGAKGGKDAKGKGKDAKGKKGAPGKKAAGKR